MVKGSCLCGTVAFEVDPAGVVAVVGCYCVPCRKVSGSQYGVYYQVRRGAFRWLSGEDGVAAFESSPGNLRGHCQTCGCTAPIATAYGATGKRQVISYMLSPLSKATREAGRER